MQRATFFALSLSLLAACESGPARDSEIARATFPTSGCVEWHAQPVDRTCVPRLARERTPLVIEVEQACGSCSASIEKCSVAVDGRTVTLSLDGKTCTSARAACADGCAKRRVACRLPGLEAGRYEIRYADASGRVDLLDVGAGADAKTACRLDDAS